MTILQSDKIITKEDIETKFGYSLLLRKNSSAFTIIELVVVIAIIGMLALISILIYKKYIEKAKVVTAISEISMLEKEVRGYEIDTGSLPSSINDINPSVTEDPWLQPYVYLTPPQRTRGGILVNNDFDLYSSGKDILTNVEITNPVSLDDIIRAGNGHFKGVAARYQP